MMVRVLANEAPISESKRLALLPPLASLAAAGRVTSFDRSDDENINGGERLVSLWSCTETTESNNTSY